MVFRNLGHGPRANLNGDASQGLKEERSDRCITMNRNRRTPPLIMIQAPFSEPLKLMSVAIKPRIIPPNSVPATIPTPPVNTVPPSTTDAMAVSSVSRARQRVA